MIAARRRGDAWGSKLYPNRRHERWGPREPGLCALRDRPVRAKYRIQMQIYDFDPLEPGGDLPLATPPLDRRPSPSQTDIKPRVPTLSAVT